MPGLATGTRWHSSVLCAFVEREIGRGLGGPLPPPGAESGSLTDTLTY
jgi:hypothetical protein